MTDVEVFEGRFIERGSAEYDAARTGALVNTRYPERYPGGCARGRK